ncbi:tRNA (adenosine(37)-N6)-threonylcarbamoyltransferase complex dimerization subunit type 1 TsaB [Algoriphagus sediminis]|uniref:tRNA (Adenosine(37)-N6)-threonylcarbamoyltransferase complex dimerization subunit type 1 TsaB n=1 Tax=Algoriphagus sediminis TaxID=3057113 RepID=A0ABT7YG58_9BACT|nr:tRNA (adenosine(37)-N6)-threonylcarbamoyltransferase complex dimerization subunit type 1 TsaB [Algoriphagus sediminis]MDN3205482.1 tRNA (adenosine(37)-N6)-threonylcarbamoyltransferase complex dimerization subunit type 1 TsaB [Algoriphagus sediminis]
MALILSIETSTTVCSVALHREGELLQLNETDEKNAHSLKLMPFVEQCLKGENLSVQDLEAISVSSGPGSYTGLRIGVSTAKGLAYALDLPIIGVSAMESLAKQVFNNGVETGHIIPVLDARRMEVYFQVFDSSLSEIGETGSLVLEQSSFSNLLNEGPVYFVGDGIAKTKELIDSQNTVFVDGSISAREMGEIAWKKLQRQEFEDTAYFVPNYLKEFKVLKSKKNLLLK